MKTVAAAFLLLFVFTCQRLSQAISDDQGADVLQQFSEQCIKESGVSADEAKLIMDVKFDNIDMKNFSDKMKCYMLCFYKKIGVVDASSKIDNEKLLKFMEHLYKEKKAKVKPAIAKCAGIKGENPCEMVYKLDVCIDENISG